MTTTRLLLFYLICVYGAYAQDDAKVYSVFEQKVCTICVSCQCEDGAVDCSGGAVAVEPLTTFFTKDEWADPVIAMYRPITVDLSRNFYQKVTAFPELPIEILNISRNQIETIERKAFSELRALRVLDMSHNKLTYRNLKPSAFEGYYSPEEYRPLSSLRVLNLACNDLELLHRDLFEHLPELTELNLNGNPIVSLDHYKLLAISSLPNLKVLHVRSCKLIGMTDKFLHPHPFLERLDISDNRLEAVPRGLQEAKNLVFLNLSQNPIDQLADMEYLKFPSLHKLQELHMCNMPELRRIGRRTLAGLDNLSSLHMCCNPELREIEPTAMEGFDDFTNTPVWPPLKQLYLQSNNLSQIDSRLISDWDQLTALDVSGNPFLCDNSTQWMVDDLVPVIEKLTPNGSDTMICHEPAEMRGYTMKHLHDMHCKMPCFDQYGGLKWAGVFIVSTLIVTVSITMLWRYGCFACLGCHGTQGPKDVSHGLKDLSNSFKDVSHGPKDVSHSPKDVFYGPNVSHGPKDVFYGPNVSHGPKDVSHVPKDVSHGPKDVSHSPKDVSHGPTDVSHDPKDVSHGPHEIV